MIIIVRALVKARSRSNVRRMHADFVNETLLLPIRGTRRVAPRLTVLFFSFFFFFSVRYHPRSTVARVKRDNDRDYPRRSAPSVHRVYWELRVKITRRPLVQINFRSFDEKLITSRDRT